TTIITNHLHNKHKTTFTPHINNNNNIIIINTNKIILTNKKYTNKIYY
ncbi:50S ribosomal protein L13, partial [Enterococcus hirae]